MFVFGLASGHLIWSNYRNHDNDNASSGQKSIYNLLRFPEFIFVHPNSLSTLFSFNAHICPNGFTRNHRCNSHPHCDKTIHILLTNVSTMIAPTQKQLAIFAKRCPACNALHEIRHESSSFMQIFAPIAAVAASVHNIVLTHMSTGSASVQPPFRVCVLMFVFLRASDERDSRVCVARKNAQFVKVRNKYSQSAVNDSVDDAFRVHDPMNAVFI